MNTVSIDLETCISCEKCIDECPEELFRISGDGETGSRVEWSDPHSWCNDCGHCVAICPGTAIRLNGDDGRERVTAREMCDYATASNLLASKRSARRYSDRPVEQSTVELILEVMRYAPSGHNAQSCEYYVVYDGEIKERLRKESAKTFRLLKTMGKLKWLIKPFVAKPLFDALDGPGLSEGMDELLRRYHRGDDPIFFHAPAVILVTVPKMGGMMTVDSTSAMTYGMLAAHSLGLGTCWMGFTMSAIANDNTIKKLLGIDRNRRISGVITLGYSDVTYERLPPRHPAKVEWIGKIPSLDRTAMRV